MSKRLSEHALIESLRAASSSRAPGGLVIGSGDDAAVFRGSASQDFVITQDALVEGRHFERRWFTGRELGWRLAAVNLSDIAAMNAKPRYALVSLSVPSRVGDEYLRELQNGAARHLRKFGAAIVGGNITGTSGPLGCDMTLVGVCRRGHAWARRARAGDAIVVVGYLGSAALGLDQMRSSRGRAKGSLVDAYKRPVPLLDVSALLTREKAVHAAIDVSDGFSADVIHMCRSGNVGCEVNGDALPVSRAFTIRCRKDGADAIARAIGGGEDYALILSVARRSAERICARVSSRLDVAAAVVGHFDGRRGDYRIHRDGKTRRMQATGWDHLSR